MHNQDGMDGVHSHMSNTQNAPIEVIESTYPLQVLRYGLVSNSEGAGKFRGGMGIMREFIALEDDLTLTLGSDREKIKPWGVDGGKGGRNSESVLIRDGKERRLPSKITTRIRKGDRYITVTPGGGGWGDPFERDSEKVRWDVSEGLVSMERAESEYGVILERLGDNLEINQEATERTRAQKKKKARK